MCGLNRIVLHGMHAETTGFVMIVPEVAFECSEHVVPVTDLSAYCTVINLEGALIIARSYEKEGLCCWGLPWGRKTCRLA